MPPFASEQFHAITSVTQSVSGSRSPLPASPGLPARYDGRHRLAARRQGDPGADRSMAPHRLSYTLDDPPGSPSVYVTWELRRTSHGTIIRLNVDERWPLTGSTEDLESSWLPVLSGLVKHLERGPSSPTDRTA